jgi:hypothetical protein
MAEYLRGHDSDQVTGAMNGACEGALGPANRIDLFVDAAARRRLAETEW